MTTAAHLNARLQPLVSGYYATHDEALLGQVLAALRPMLLTYVRHTLGLPDADRAADLVQDVLLGLVLDLRAHRYAPSGSFVGYVRVCCRNRFYNARSLRRDQPAQPGASDDPFLRLGPAGATLPDELPLVAEQEAEAGGLLAAATGAVLNLDPNARAAVVLHYYQGLPVPEAAARLGLDEQQYRTRLNRGLAALRQWGQGQAHPSGEVYARLPRLPTGDLFTEPLRLAS